ncbi:MAG: glycoside hydrolase family 95 protein [Bacteroidales bacterium]|nr:glycoside hydrolase family 95 protein [Bacteroidales bacterium]
MKRSFLFLLCLTVVACGREGAKVQRQLILHYDRPAAFFEEALPIGNGRLGAKCVGCHLCRLAP